MSERPLRVMTAATLAPASKAGHSLVLLHACRVFAPRFELLSSFAEQCSHDDAERQLAATKLIHDATKPLGEIVVDGYAFVSCSVMHGFG